MNMKDKKSVLVTGDTLLARETLCALLESIGFEVCGCEDGASALDAASKNDFHAIIIDYRMPHMNGVEATTRLRLRSPLSTIIGVSLGDRREDFLAAGADAFLLKPYRYRDLLTLIINAKR